MDEARRFLRYVIPGALFATELLLLLLIIVPEWASPILAGLKNDSGIGVAIAALLGSGALGFLFGTIHHWLHWNCPRWLHPGVNYINMLRHLRSSGLLRVLDGSGNIVAEDWTPSRTQAWAMVTALWHERVTDGNGIHAANHRGETLSNLVHSVGTAAVASLFAMISAIIILLHLTVVTLEVWNVLRFVAATILSFALTALHEHSYRDVLGITQSFVAEVLGDTLAAEELPVQTRFFEAP